jgi:hypothetical protein
MAIPFGSVRTAVLYIKSGRSGKVEEVKWKS